MSEYSHACGDHTAASKDKKYVRGCMYAHKKAFESIAAGAKSCLQRQHLSESRVESPLPPPLAHTRRLHSFTAGA